MEVYEVIIPGAATPTGVFMLRQYMLTIPDELLEAARMDACNRMEYLLENSVSIRPYQQ